MCRRCAKKQLLTYLRLSDKRLGLLVNFNVAWIKQGGYQLLLAGSAVSLCSRAAGSSAWLEKLRPYLLLRILPKAPKLAKAVFRELSITANYKKVYLETNLLSSSGRPKPAISLAPAGYS